MRATFVLIATVGVTVALLGTVQAQRGPLPSPMIKEGITENIFRSRLRDSGQQRRTCSEHRHHRRQQGDLRR